LYAKYYMNRLKSQNYFILRQREGTKVVRWIHWQRRNRLIHSGKKMSFDIGRISFDSGSRGLAGSCLPLAAGSRISARGCATPFHFQKWTARVAEELRSKQGAGAWAAPRAVCPCEAYDDHGQGSGVHSRWPEAPNTRRTALQSTPTTTNGRRSISRGQEKAGSRPV
jgi:hypothetical protein